MSTWLVDRLSSLHSFPKCQEVTRIKASMGGTRVPGLRALKSLISMMTGTHSFQDKSDFFEQLTVLFVEGLNILPTH